MRTGRRNRRNKAAFLNFSCVVWTRPWTQHRIQTAKYVDYQRNGQCKTRTVGRQSGVKCRLQTADCRIFKYIILPFSLPWTSIPSRVGVDLLLAASCYRSWVSSGSYEPVWSKASLPVPLTLTDEPGQYSGWPD